MEEDEEVVTAGSPFYQHLHQVGFGAIETKLDSDPLTEGLTTEENIKGKQLIDKSFLDAAKLIQDTNLLFEDDQEHVNLVFSNLSVDRNETLKNIFKGNAVATMIALGLGLFILIGYLAFVVISLFFVYRTTECFWQKHRRSSRMKKFVGIIASNYKVLCRVIKFVHENETLIRTRFGENSSARVSHCLSTLKQDLISVQRVCNNEFSAATSALLGIPLQECIDSTEGYICAELGEFDDGGSVAQLHNLFMLLQSQFLTRFIFSIVPELTADSGDYSKVIDKIMVRLAVQLNECQRSLNSKYNFILKNGISIDKSGSPRPLPAKRKYARGEALVENIHDLSNSLQYLLIRARELEAAVESKKTESTQRELEAIQNELVLCQKHISDIFIMQKKMSNVPSNDCEIIQPNDLTEPISITEIGYPDLDPCVDDDIFEAIIDDCMEREVKESWVEADFDPLARKKQREMLGELKSRLKEKAENWAERESKVLERKGLPPREVVTDEKLHESSSEDDSRFGRNVFRKRKLKCQRYGESSSDDDEARGLLRLNAQGSRQEFAVFGQAFQLARATVDFNLHEDSFCASGLNSDAEDNGSQL